MSPHPVTLQSIVTKQNTITHAVTMTNLVYFPRRVPQRGGTTMALTQDEKKAILDATDVSWYGGSETYGGVGKDGVTIVAR